MKVLITGANGFLGQHLTLFLSQKKFDVIACGRGACRIPGISNFIYSSIDLTNKETVYELVQKTNPDVIIHASAISKPDDCEANKENCILQNVEVTKYLIEACRNLKKVHFIYVSTDFVFGENGPHSEEDNPNPLNFYGESKLSAEFLINKSKLAFTIIRPVFIYGPVWEGLRPSFLHWIKNNLEEHKKIKVVSDQHRTPTFVIDICKAIETIILNKKTGVFHIAGKEILSPYQMATRVCAFLGLDAALIEDVTSESFKEIVVRAKKSGLKIEKAIKELNYDPTDFEKGIELTFNWKH